MMYRLVLRSMAVGIAVIGLGTTADAGKRDWYFSLEAGVDSGTSNTSFSANTGLAVIGAIGKELGDGFKLEGELGYRNSERGSYDVDVLSLLANVIYEVPLSKTVSWDLSAGAGLADTTVDGFGTEWGDTQGVLQLRTGINFEIADETRLGFNARYMTALSGGTWAPNDLNDVNNITFTVGVTFGF